MIGYHKFPETGASPSTDTQQRGKVMMEPFRFNKVFIGRTEDKDRVFVDASWDGTRLSLTGCVLGKGQQEFLALGQIANEVCEVIPRLADLWDRWHLNDLRAGCAHQEQAYRDGIAVRPTYNNDYAGMNDPCPECGYKYGSAWNTETVPDEVLAEIHAILSEHL